VIGSAASFTLAPLWFRRAIQTPRGRRRQAMRVQNWNVAPSTGPFRSVLKTKPLLLL
jgi:hypothetical protein